jgi:hemoglobin-like flavoprotein
MYSFTIRAKYLFQNRALFPQPNFPWRIFKMNLRQKELIQSSFEKIVPIADTAAALFYGRIFELDPTLRPMFITDLQVQGKKFMNMLSLIVGGLDNLYQLVPEIQALGRRHVGYGAKPEHYHIIASALLWTLEKGLGDVFTLEVKEAWMAIFTLLSNVMQEAAANMEEAESKPIGSKSIAPLSSPGRVE